MVNLPWDASPTGLLEPANAAKIYKLITHGTVEEKILALQQKKRAIIKATLGGEETLADNLTWEEIQGLFE